jgi:hypothetical protein
MLLHLGEERSVRLETLVAILDYGLFKKANAQFLQMAKSEGRLDPGGELPAESVVIAGGRVIFSQLSRKTMTGRAGLGLPVGIRRPNKRLKDQAPGDRGKDRKPS